VSISADVAQGFGAIQSALEFAGGEGDVGLKKARRAATKPEKGD